MSKPSKLSNKFDVKFVLVVSNKTLWRRRKLRDLP